MKKIERYLYLVIILILIGIIIGGTTYIVLNNKNDNKITETDKNNDKENDKQPDDNTDKELDGKVSLVSVTKDIDKITENFEVTINGKIKTINIDFSYTKEEYQALEGNFGNISLTYDEYNNSFTKDSILTESNIKAIFNENNFEFIKGNDNKSYLLVYGEKWYDDIFKFVYVFNEDMELISNNIPFELNNPDLSNYFAIIRNYDVVTEIAEKDQVGYNKEYNRDVLVKVEDNKIYYLVPNFEYDKFTENYYGTLEERVYYIDNDKLEYDLINTYTITKVAQMM